MNSMTCEGQFKLETVGPYTVESIRYLGDPPYDSTTRDKKPKLAASKSSPMMTIRFTNGCVAQFRASGKTMLCLRGDAFGFMRIT
jgi:hypothetical protein